MYDANATIPTPDVPLNPPPQKKSNRTLIIVVVVLVLLCCCCVCLGASGSWLYQNYDSMGDPFGLYGTLRLLPSLI
jgi:hypothetical protein